MPRGAWLAISLLAAASALAGVWLRDSVLAVTVVAGLVGLAVAGWLARSVDGRLARVSDWVLMLGEGHVPDALDLGGSREWRRLDGALTAVGEVTRARYHEQVAERARVERLLDNLPTAVLLFSGGRLSYANPAARALFSVERSTGWSPLRVLGVDVLAQAVVETSETGRTVDVEVRRDDRELAARASVAGEDEVALTVADLTETRRVESIRRDFVTNASHELKTPVAGIQALADSLGFALGRDPDRAKTMVERIQKEAARLAQLVRELLDLARLEEATAQRHHGRCRVDLAALVSEQVDRYLEFARREGVTLSCDCDAPAWLVSVPEDLRLIVANLLENAVQYNRWGGTVRASACRDSGDVVLEIADTGCGIAESEQGRIFERFYRIDKGRSRAAGGTGLGLSIVRHAAERHGGRVTVDSVLGEGSTFRVVLPVEGSPP
ncbi:MAG: sensor histidine kinase [Egibacteraceae bacterium]